MKRLALLIAWLLIAPLQPCLAENLPAAAFVKSLYGEPTPEGYYQQTLNIFLPEARELYVSARLRAALAEMDKRTPEGDAPDLDFDAVSAGNDPDVRDLKISVESESADKAVVIADFQPHQDAGRTVLRFLLVREGGGWKVDDIIASGKANWRISEIVAGH